MSFFKLEVKRQKDLLKIVEEEEVKLRATDYDEISVDIDIVLVKVVFDFYFLEMQQRLDKCMSLSIIKYIFKYILDLVLDFFIEGVNVFLQEFSELDSLIIIADTFVQFNQGIMKKVNFMLRNISGQFLEVD